MTFILAINYWISKNFSNYNPIGIDRRSMFFLNSGFKNAFDFKSDLIPKKPFLYFLKNLKIIPPFAVGFLLRLFKHRPIWTKGCIENYLPIAIKKYLRKIFPFICYQFKGMSPFRDAWIRFKFDPRKHPKTSIYKTTLLRKNF